ncbi:MAG: molecular chaperone TorD family protein [Sulfurovum sp.]|nr:molecular chaperone TorD family protein [Sulfurovum sp.]
MNKESVDSARSLYYGLFSKMLVFSDSQERFEGVREALEIMVSNPMEPNSGEALKELLAYMNEDGYRVLSEEFDEVFHNPESAIVRTTASFYDEGVESGKKRLEVKNFLGKTKIRRDEINFKDSEDSVGFLMTFMHELTELVISGDSSYAAIEHCLFDEVINSLLDMFIPSLYENKSAEAYKSLAIVMNAFLEFERLYFDVAKPKPIELVERKVQDCEPISDEEAKRRAKNRSKRSADALAQGRTLDDSSFEDEVGVSDM